MQNHANIDCRRKKVVFKLPGRGRLTIKGVPRRPAIGLISYLQAQKLLANGGMKYLANMVDSSKDPKLKPEDLPVVQGFEDVFPKDLPRLPPY